MDIDLTPDRLARGLEDELADEDLPMLAAQWLAADWDSDELRELAGMSRTAARSEARRLLPAVLASLGYELRSSSPGDDVCWRGHWASIAWARDAMDDRLSPYAAAQRVLDVLGDVPDLWKPGGGSRLLRLLSAWVAAPDRRQQTDALLRRHIQALRRDDAPPLVEDIRA